MDYRVNKFFDKKNIDIKLPGKMNDLFQLTVEQGYEQEALEIFNVELLNFLSMKAYNYSIEFSRNKIYLYDDKLIGTYAELNELYEVVKKIIDISGKLIDRLHDDFDALHSYYGDRK